MPDMKFSPELGQRIVSSLESGDSLTKAADKEGVTYNAVKRWITKGMGNRPGPYATFARAAKAAMSRSKAERVVESYVESPSNKTSAEWKQTDRVEYYTRQLAEIERDIEVAYSLGKISHVPALRKRSEVAFEALQSALAETPAEDLSEEEAFNDVIVPAIQGLHQVYLEQLAVIIADKLRLDVPALRVIQGGE